MTEKPTSFHVRHDLQPSLTYELLNLFLARPNPLTEDELGRTANEYGYRLRVRKNYTKLIKSLTELDILNQAGNGFTLTDKGRILARITQYQRALLADFIHFLYYSSFDLDANKRFSWSYRKVCDALWYAAPSPIDRDRLVNQITREASSSFGQNGISFSTSSIAGIVNWLIELIPNCVTVYGIEQRFVRRDYCSVELFTLALDHEYRIRNHQDKSYIAIDAQFQNEVCKLCLINTERFFEMLSVAEDNFACIDVRRERGDRISMAKFDWTLLEG